MNRAQRRAEKFGKPIFIKRKEGTKIDKMNRKNNTRITQGRVNIAVKTEEDKNAANS